MMKRKGRVQTMLKSRDFYIGILVGVVAYYVYCNHVKKGMGGGA
jgi:hypothetical protein